MAALLAIILCAGTGWCVARLGLGSGKTNNSILEVSLAGPFGLGVFSLTYFAWRLFSTSRASLIGIDVAVLVVLTGFVARIHKKRSLPSPDTAIPTPKLPFGSTLWAMFAAALAVAAYCSIGFVKADPQGGGWDAIAIWNLHARFLFLGGEQWRAGFSQLIPWSHPDYPLLVPATIAHFWTYLGTDTELVPAAIGLAFMFSTVGVLYASVRTLRSASQALLSGILLASTPFFLRQGASQYADVPLCFFILATIALSMLYSAKKTAGLLALSGAAAAFAAWTKNEGLLFFCAFLVVRVFQLVIRKDWRTLAAQVSTFLLGAAPVLLVLAYFKLAIAPPGDLLASGSSMLSKIADLSRYWLIVRWFGKELFLFTGLPVLTIIVVIYGKLLGSGLPRKLHDSVWTSAAALALTLAGYFAVYVITPYDLRWHLRFSLNRLMLQLWPSALFLFFVAVRTPEEWLAEKSGEVSPESDPASIGASAIDKAA